MSVAPGGTVASLSRIVWLGPLLLIEIAIIGALHQFMFDVECRQLAAAPLCHEVRKLAVRGAAVMAVAMVYGLARHRRLAALLAAPPQGAALAQAMAAHGLGVAAAALAVGFAAPDLAALADALWRWPALSDATFAAVFWTLETFGRDVAAQPALYLLKIDGFVVGIGPECSGVQGMVLITLFSGLHLGLARRTLRFPHAFAIPAAALALSWVFNVARLSALAVIGADVSPTLAVGGFHSQAGWIAFSVLAVIVLSLSAWRPLRVAQGAWSPPHAAPEALRPAPLLADRAVAEIAPFAATLFASMAATAAAAQPGMLAPAVAVIGAAVTLVFRRPLLAELRPPAGVAVLAGLAAGALWVATAPPSSPSDAGLTLAVAGLGAVAAAAWTAIRVIGAALVTPVVEELFFRSYLARRLDPGGRHVSARWGAIIAAVAGAALFAALHDRWIAAFLAGLLFAALRLRRGALIDAVAGHAACNGVIVIAVLSRRGWSIL